MRPRGLTRVGSRRLPAEPRARAASRLRGLRSGVRRWPGPRGSCARAARWPGTGLAADAGDRAFDGCSSCPEDASGGACSTVIAVRVECQATPTPGRAAAQGARSRRCSKVRKCGLPSWNSGLVGIMTRRPLCGPAWDRRSARSGGERSDNSKSWAAMSRCHPRRKSEIARGPVFVRKGMAAADNKFPG